LSSSVPRLVGARVARVAVRLNGSDRMPVVIFSLVYLLTQRQCEDWRRRMGWSASMLDDEAARARGHSLGYQDSNLD
jgi:hypothetical protein